MAITLDTQATDTIELAEFIDLVASVPDLSLDALAALAEPFRRLSNHRTFLVDRIVEELKAIHDFQRANSWNLQTLVLGGVAGKFTVRANAWLPRRMLRSTNAAAGAAQFSFEQAHDHNYDFLTVGYLGEGYETEIWECDDVGAAEPGAPAALRFLERTTLPEHKVMLYRASRDVHIQLPPCEDFSISLNLMPPAIPGREQYLFDFQRGEVSAVFMSETAHQASLIEAAGHLCDGNVAEVLADIADKHASPRIRQAARGALAIDRPEPAEPA